MLNVNRTIDGEKEVLSLEGKLDTLTSRGFTEEISKTSESTKQLVLDFEKLTYISSAGIRAILTALNKMDEKGGELKIVNVSETIMEILDIVGIAGDLNIE